MPMGRESFIEWAAHWVPDSPPGQRKRFSDALAAELGTSPVHIAGFPVKVGSEGRQLCAWCGLVLFDVDYSRIAWALNEDGSDPGPPQPWDVGALVRKEGNMTCVVAHVDGEALPAGCCANPPLRAV